MFEQTNTIAGTGYHGSNKMHVLYFYAAVNPDNIGIFVHKFDIMRLHLIPLRQQLAVLSQLWYAGMIFCRNQLPTASFNMHRRFIVKAKKITAQRLRDRLM
jgi:hypothetical protein